MGPHFFTAMKKVFRKNVIIKSCVIEEGMFSIERNTILVHIRQDIAVFLIFHLRWLGVLLESELQKPFQKLFTWDKFVPDQKICVLYESEVHFSFRPKAALNA